MNYKRKLRLWFFLLVRSRTPPISSEFRGGGVFEHPKPPPLGTPMICINLQWILQPLQFSMPLLIYKFWMLFIKPRCMLFQFIMTWTLHPRFWNSLYHFLLPYVTPTIILILWKWANLFEIWVWRSLRLPPCSVEIESLCTKLLCSLFTY